MISWAPGVVRSVAPHPAGDRIWVAQVRAGGQVLQVVFGGVPGIVVPGCTVPVLLPGTRDVNGRKVRQRRYRGVVSQAVMCSAAEAGLGPGTDRVLVLA